MLRLLIGAPVRPLASPCREAILSSDAVTFLSSRRRLGESSSVAIALRHHCAWAWALFHQTLLTLNIEQEKQTYIVAALRPRTLLMNWPLVLTPLEFHDPSPVGCARINLFAQSALFLLSNQASSAQPNACVPTLNNQRTEGRRLVRMRKSTSLGLLSCSSV